MARRRPALWWMSTCIRSTRLSDVPLLCSAPAKAIRRRRRIEARRKHAAIDLRMVAGPCNAVCGDLNRLDRGSLHRPDHFRGVIDAVGKKSDRLDAAAPGTEPRASLRVVSGPRAAIC